MTNRFYLLIVMLLVSVSCSCSPEVSMPDAKSLAAKVRSELRHKLNRPHHPTNLGEIDAAACVRVKLNWLNWPGIRHEFDEFNYC